MRIFAVMSKTIAITGASGMVGAHLCCQALKKGYTVKAIVRKPLNSGAFLIQLLKYKGIDNAKLEILECDYEDRQNLSNILENCDALYHCAAKVNFDGKVSDMIAANVSLSKRIVNICLELGIKNVAYLSSIAAIGSKNKGKLTWGNLHWNGLYGYTKFLGELEFLRGQEEGLNSHIYRAGIVVGPSPSKHPFTNMLKRKVFGKVPYTKGSSGFISVQILCKKMLENFNTNPYEPSVMVSHNLDYKHMAKIIAKHCNTGVINIKKWQLRLVQILGFCAKLIGLQKQRLRSHSIKSMLSKSDYLVLSESDSIEDTLYESMSFLGKGKV